MTDTGPLVALIDAGEADHDRCRELLGAITRPMLITWPVFTEAVYLLGDAGGWKAQNSLWSLVLRSDVEIVALSDSAFERTRWLMQKYRDRPMSLADATLVALAEERGIKQIFTLDSDFDFYRIRGRETFSRIP